MQFTTSHFLLLRSVNLGLCIDSSFNQQITTKHICAQPYFYDRNDTKSLRKETIETELDTCIVILSVSQDTNKITIHVQDLDNNCSIIYLNHLVITFALRVNIYQKFHHVIFNKSINGPHYIIVILIFRDMIRNICVCTSSSTSCKPNNKSMHIFTPGGVLVSSTRRQEKTTIRQNKK